VVSQVVASEGLQLLHIARFQAFIVSTVKISPQMRLLQLVMNALVMVKMIVNLAMIVIMLDEFF
jgi:hypothetical protein